MWRNYLPIEIPINLMIIKLSEKALEKFHVYSYVNHGLEGGRHCLPGNSILNKRSATIFKDLQLI